MYRDAEREFLREPSLEGLSYLLRNLSRLRPDWKWNFEKENSCAYGLFYDQWPTEEEKFFSGPCGMGFWSSLNIFFGWGIRHMPNRHVRPYHIAYLIDKYLEKHPEMSKSQRLYAFLNS
jgi:hypothetical protein